jgi:hypothetical protein
LAVNCRTIARPFSHVTHTWVNPRKCCEQHLAEIFLVGGRGNQRIAMSSDLIRDR